MWKLGHLYPEGKLKRRCKSPSSHHDIRHHISLASTSILEHMLDVISNVLHLQRQNIMQLNRSVREAYIMSLEFEVIHHYWRYITQSVRIIQFEILAIILFIFITIFI